MCWVLLYMDSQQYILSYIYYSISLYNVLDKLNIVISTGVSRTSWKVVIFSRLSNSLEFSNSSINSKEESSRKTSFILAVTWFGLKPFKCKYLVTARSSVCPLFTLLSEQITQNCSYRPMFHMFFSLLTDPPSYTFLRHSVGQFHLLFVLPRTRFISHLVISHSDVPCSCLSASATGWPHPCYVIFAERLLLMIRWIFIWSHRLNDDASKTDFSRSFSRLNDTMISVL